MCDVVLHNDQLQGNLKVDLMRKYLSCDTNIANFLFVFCFLFIIYVDFTNDNELGWVRTFLTTTLAFLVPAGVSKRTGAQKEP